MPDYTKGKIYKLVSPSGLVYIGSTVQRLSLRKAEHKRRYNLFSRHGIRFISSYELYKEGPENIDIILLENYSCNSIEELHKKEREYIENNNCVNINIPSRKKKELVTCSDCKKSMTTTNSSRHKKSKYHLKSLQPQIVEQ